MFSRSSRPGPAGWPDFEAVPLENGEVEANAAFLVYRSHLETIIGFSPVAGRTCYGR